uniref:Uncharacterized protein n=1 Tax=Chlorocebus sabaeus TaxID=60711 RepID=A0A0D9RYU4_CHLSB
MAEPVKEEAKTSNPTSSLTSLSVAPTFSRNITLGPVNSSDSDNGTTRTASTNCIGTTISANGMWLPDNQFTDARTEPWEGNSSTTATTPETFPPSDVLSSHSLHKRHTGSMLREVRDPKWRDRLKPWQKNINCEDFMDIY